MPESHLPQRKAFKGCMITKDAATISIHEMHFPYVLWMKLLATGPKMAQRNESGWYALYFQTKLSSEPVLTEGAARQQCLLTHFPYMFGQSPNLPSEISWRTLLRWHWPSNKGAALPSSLSPPSPALQTLVSLEKNITYVQKRKNFNVNVLPKNVSAEVQCSFTI